MSRIDIREEAAWARLYCQYFKKPFDFDPEMIEKTLELELGPWDRSMLIQVMRWMTSKGQSWPKTPSGRELAIAYKVYSKHGTGSPVNTPEGFVNFVKAKMRAAATFIERWNIMCSPEVYCGAARTTTREECDTLDAWARTQWTDWHKPDSRELQTDYHAQEVPF